MERFLFPKLVYSVTEGPLSDKRMPTAMIYTMNVTEEFCQEKLRFHSWFIRNSYWKHVHQTIFLKAYNTYQFKDYSKYKNDIFKESEKAKHRDEQFPVDLKNAFELGIKIAEDAQK